ncbi:hypothetical protein fugu_011485 [Takifugu bimaculatus]|uniref:EF-hand domain-containing protein n=1 Tax=Takifugu bimaculatus TaxID=433685 RepID=A0A4Z2C7V9_9TELE|nr:hypothetical protein fugu_011485 [Takifugu bimaculatus]
MAAPCQAGHAALWLHPDLKRRRRAHKLRSWARPKSCLCFVTKRARASSRSEICRGYRASCHFPPNSWRRFLRVWTAWSNGFLTPVEFNTGLGELVGLEDTADLSQNQPEEELNGLDLSEDPTVVRAVNVLTELGGDKHFKDQREFFSLWYELQKDRPELLSVLEGILIHAVSQLQDCIRERDSLEQALRRRESEHDQMVRSIYEDMESQIREEREKRSAQESIRQKQRGELEEVLRIRDQDLENTLSKQKELESRIQQLSAEQANIKAHNVQLRSLNVQLQEQVEHSKEQLQAALAQLGTLQHSADQEQMDRQRKVMRVSRNIQKEKESLLRQLELLRDMNRRLRDEKDAQESQKRVSHNHSVLPHLPINYYLSEDLCSPWTPKIYPT